MENPIKMDDLGGKPTIFGNTSIWDMEDFYHLDSKKFSNRTLNEVTEPRKNLFVSNGSIATYLVR